VAREDTFNTVKITYTILGGFLKDVAKEIGMKKAISLYAKQGKTVGAMLAGMTREKLGKKEFDMKTFASVLSGALQSNGLTYDIKESPTLLIVNSHRCPIYEGLKDAGLDHKTIELACSHISGTQYVALKKAFPQLNGRVKFRSAPNKPCVEKFALEK